jgi:hypothetical protein
MRLGLIHRAVCLSGINEAKGNITATADIFQLHHFSSWGAAAAIIALLQGCGNDYGGSAMPEKVAMVEAREAHAPIQQNPDKLSGAPRLARTECTPKL